MSITRKIIERYTRNRPPHINIGPGYLLRWYILPRNKIFNVYLHCFLRSDDDRALHDHPWMNISLVLLEHYVEHTPNGRKTRRAGNIVFRWPTSRHRIVIPIVNGGISYCWTLFITGPRIREWGFWCKQGFVHWKDFLMEDDSTKTGKGCDQ